MSTGNVREQGGSRNRRERRGRRSNEAEWIWWQNPPHYFGGYDCFRQPCGSRLRDKKILARAAESDGVF